MSHASSIDKCKKKCDVITFSENKMSTKMLKAMMLKMGNGKISYHNTRTKSTHTTIMRLNYIENRLLLLRYKYKLYYHYVRSLSNINKDTYAKILQMLQDLLDDLSDEEKRIVYNIPPPEPDIPETFKDSGIVFKVFTKRLARFSYFIFTNITTSYGFETGLFYTFDLSDPTNLGTRLCFSLEKDGVAYDCQYSLDPDKAPGKPGATMKLNLSINIPYTRLYVFNKDEPEVNKRYQNWGYSYESIFVNRDKLNIDDVTYEEIKTFDKNFLKFVVYEWYGPKLTIDTYFSSDPTTIPNNTVYIYKNNYVFQFGIGVYYIYLHNFYSIAFLNRDKKTTGISSEYNRGTKYLDQLFLARNKLDKVDQLDTNYTFHSGLIRLTVQAPFDPITVYNDKYGYMGSLFMIQYNNTALRKEAIPNDFVYTRVGNRYGLDSYSTFNFVPVLGDTVLKFTFQNIPYNVENKVAMTEGVYTIYNTYTNTNTKDAIPIALLNANKESWIDISSISTKKDNNEPDSFLGFGPNGETCRFYYGTIRITVKGNFGLCSLYTPRKGLLDGGYRGGYGLLVYDKDFSNEKTYTNEDMTPPTFIPNNFICPVELEKASKEISGVTLIKSAYTMNTEGLFDGIDIIGEKIGDMEKYDMRFKLEIREYTFGLSGNVIIYRTDALKNTRTIGTSTIIDRLYPQYNSTFYVDGTSIDDFYIIYTQGTKKYTYFMTYQN